MNSNSLSSFWGANSSVLMTQMSNVSVLDEFLLTPWIMKLKNLQHSTCAMLTYLNATVPSKSKSSHSTSMNALLGSTNFWASGYAKWPVYHFWLGFSEYLDISIPTGPKASTNQKAAHLNSCEASNVHDGLAIPEKKTLRIRKASINAMIESCLDMRIWYTTSYTTWQKHK